MPQRRPVDVYSGPGLAYGSTRPSLVGDGPCIGSDDVAAFARVLAVNGLRARPIALDLHALAHARLTHAARTDHHTRPHRITARFALPALPS